MAARASVIESLAEAVGSSQRAISHYETIAEFPPTGVLVQLAKVLGVSADYILNLKTPKAAPAMEFLDPKTKKLWKKFQQLQQLPEKGPASRHTAHQLAHLGVEGCVMLENNR